MSSRGCGRRSTRFDAAPEHQQALDRSIEQLDELFLLVIVGEFNAGKSAFINALLGSQVVAEGVTPTTAQINVLQYGDTRRAARARVQPARHHRARRRSLREIHIVDTPGTNAIIREHEAITAEFVPRSDLVLFVTSADRPFTETERAFLEQVRGWGKKVVVVINKIDILESARDVEDGPHVRRRERARAARLQPGDLPGERAAGAPRQAGGAAAVGGERLRGARELHRDDARRAGPRASRSCSTRSASAPSMVERHAGFVRDRLALLKDDFDDARRGRAAARRSTSRT